MWGYWFCATKTATKRRRLCLPLGALHRFDVRDLHRTNSACSPMMWECGLGRRYLLQLWLDVGLGLPLSRGCMFYLPSSGWCGHFFVLPFLSPFLAGVALPGARSVPAGDRSVPSLPSLLWLGVPAIWGQFFCVGGVIVDFGTTNLPIPIRLRWYGLATVELLSGVFRFLLVCWYASPCQGPPAPLWVVWCPRWMKIPVMRRIPLCYWRHWEFWSPLHAS